MSAWEHIPLNYEKSNFNLHEVPKRKKHVRTEGQLLLYRMLYCHCSVLLHIISKVNDTPPFFMSSRPGMQSPMYYTDASTSRAVTAFRGWCDIMVPARAVTGGACACGIYPKSKVVESMKMKFSARTGQGAGRIVKIPSNVCFISNDFLLFGRSTVIQLR